MTWALLIIQIAISERSVLNWDNNNTKGLILFQFLDSLQYNVNL